jgi:hypothetical protein
MISLLYAALPRLQRMRRTLARTLNLNSSEFAVIISLLRAEDRTGLRIRRVADELHVASTQVTATIVKLERMGWLDRTSDPKDNRAVGGLACHVTLDELLRYQAPAAHPAGDPLLPLLAYANGQSDYLGGLRAGQVVTTGSLCGVIPIHTAGLLKAHLGKVGEVSVRFAI